MKQVIYLDVLIFLNTAVTFVLLLVCSRIMNLTPSAGRYVSGSLLGGASSLIIFAPDMGIFLSLIIKLLFSLIIVFAVYNPKRLKSAVKQTAYFFTVSFIFAGIMLYISSIPDLSIISYNNGVSYIELSMFSLIGAAVVCYVVTGMLNRLTHYSYEGNIMYNIRIKCGKNSVSTSSVLDTGNGLTDPFSGESLIIASKCDVEKLMPLGVRNYITGNSDKCESIRLVPCSTITGETLLPVFRAEEVMIIGNGMKKKLHDVGIAVCLNETGNVILPANILEK